MLKLLKPGPVILMFLFVCSCEEITEWNYKTGDNHILTVEAIITDEFKYQEVLLSLSTIDINAIPAPASGAKIVLKGGNETFTFSEDHSQSGLYKSDKAFYAKLNTAYSLEIDWNNKLYEAENDMVQIIPFTPVTFKPFNDTDSLTFDQTPSAFSPHEQAMYDISVDWSELISSGKTESRYLYFTFSTIDVNEIFKPAKQIPAFPKLSIVIEKKYSLNKKDAAYFRSVLMETEWQGGAFDEASAPVQGNISNGGLGYFCVCAVLSDTLIAK